MFMSFSGFENVLLSLCSLTLRDRHRTGVFDDAWQAKSGGHLMEQAIDNSVSSSGCYGCAILIAYIGINIVISYTLSRKNWMMRNR